MRLRPRTLGVYMPAQFNEPQNPFGLSGLAAYVPAAFNEPQNPFGVSRVQSGGLGCLGCLGDTGSSLDLSGIGTSITSAWQSLQQYQVAGIPVVYLAGGGLLLLLLMKGGSQRSLSRRAASLGARARYLQSKADLKSRYPGLVTRTRRRFAAATA